jgi:DNA-binding transcriptional MerR regulator
MKYRISEVSKLTDVPISTIHMWLDLKLIKHTQTGIKNHCRFGDKDIERIKLIKSLYKEFKRTKFVRQMLITLKQDNADV